MQRVAQITKTRLIIETNKSQIQRFNLKNKYKEETIIEYNNTLTLNITYYMLTPIPILNL